MALYWRVRSPGVVLWRQWNRYRSPKWEPSLWLGTIGGWGLQVGLGGTSRLLRNGNVAFGEIRHVSGVCWKGCLFLPLITERSRGHKAYGSYVQIQMVNLVLKMSHRRVEHRKLAAGRTGQWAGLAGPSKLHACWAMCSERVRPLLTVLPRRGCEMLRQCMSCTPSRPRGGGARDLWLFLGHVVSNTSALLLSRMFP
jgi:hypothetical protein